MLLRRRAVTACAAAIGLFAGLAIVPPAHAVKVFENDDMTLELGVRLQPRMEYSRIADPRGGKQWLRDYFIRRARLKANGKYQKALYTFEMKIDRTDNYSVTPSAQVENAYIQYPLAKGIDLRVGLYDLPFSRDLLTSDSKHLAVDRGAVSNVPNALGLADNAVGFDLRGRLQGGKVEYAVGAYDNRVLPSPFQQIPMVMGRIDLNLLSTKDIYRDCHFGTDRWCSFGINGGYQGKIENAAGLDEGYSSIGGVDGMVDVPFGRSRLFGRGEANVIKLRDPAGGNTLDTRVWMLGAGILLGQKLQPMARFDEIRPDDAAGGGVTDITYVGANYYLKEHNLKVQGDMQFQSGTGDQLDGVRLQAQVDF
jgi:hypothetical protein